MTAWGVGGFMAVAAFWMAVGLLSLSDSPWSGPEPPRDALRTEAPGCTALTLDRRLGHTTAEPCRHSAPLREVVASTQADFARP